MKKTIILFVFLSSVIVGYSQNSDYNKVLDKLKTIFEKQSIDSVSVLDLTGYDINTIPKEVYKLNNLRVLILDNTNIDHISNEIGNMEALEVLSLNKTKIREFPISLLQLRKLEVLAFNYTGIINIPKGICKMENLRELSLMFNSGIDKINDDILKNEKLKVFYICYYRSSKEVKDIVDKLQQKGVDVSNACK